VEVNAAAPENGNVRFTVTSKVGNGEKPNSFFSWLKDSSDLSLPSPEFGGWQHVHILTAVLSAVAWT
jgi:hypothetical protein